MTQNNIAKDIRKNDLSHSVHEGGSVDGSDLSIEPIVDNRPLPSSTLNSEESEEVVESQGIEGRGKLPTSIAIVIRTVAPLFIGVLSIVLFSLFEGSVRYVFSFIAILSFAWYALQFAWVEKEPVKHRIS